MDGDGQPMSNSNCRIARTRGSLHDGDTSNPNYDSEQTSRAHAVCRHLCCERPSRKHVGVNANAPLMHICMSSLCVWRLKGQPVHSSNEHSTAHVYWHSDNCTYTVSGESACKYARLMPTNSIIIPSSSRTYSYPPFGHPQPQQQFQCLQKWRGR